MHCLISLLSPALRKRSVWRTFLSSYYPFARMMVLSRRLLSESYLDAALHDVLLHLLSQIPDHMPCTDSFRVLLPSAQNTYSRICNIHIRQQFSIENGISSDASAPTIALSHSVSSRRIHITR
jgi:hypothetical protein